MRRKGLLIILLLLTCVLLSPQICLALDGDLNNDGRVDITDLVLVGSNFGRSTSQGDANGDGRVDIADLVMVGSNFGRTTGPSPTTRLSPTPTSTPGSPAPTPGYEGELVKPAVRNPNRWAVARCNDGSPFAFKIEKPISNKTDNWVIYFQGGGLCDDNALSCAERSKDTPSIITTLPGSDGRKYQVIGNQGIFNHDPQINPFFYNANKVYAHYCSSDVWSGSTSTLHQTSAGRWYFSGRINARAMFEILKEQYGLDDSNQNTKIILTGGSAGCMGANVNAEQAIQFLPNTAIAGRLKLVSDGCYIPNFNNPNYPLGNSDDSIREAIIQAYSFWNSSINSKCESDQRKIGQAPGSCFMGSVLYPYLTECGNKGLCLPNLVQYSSIDHWAVTTHNINPKASSANIVLEEWRNVTLNELANGKINWLFSGGEISYHTLLMKDIGWKYGPKGGPTFGELVNSFWEEEAPQRIIFGNP